MPKHQRETQMLRAVDWYTGIQRMTFGTMGLFLLDRTCINPSEFLNPFLQLIEKGMSPCPLL